KQLRVLVLGQPTIRAKGSTMSARIAHIVAMLSAVVLAMLAVVPAAAAEPTLHPAIGLDAIQRTWTRTDKPTADQQVDRTWMWGPWATGNLTTEPYRQSPDGQRQVMYFDKSRMEINHPGDDPPGLWYVTNGLLVNELISGRVQVGDDQFTDAMP